MFRRLGYATSGHFDGPRRRAPCGRRAEYPILLRKQEGLSQTNCSSGLRRPWHLRSLPRQPLTPSLEQGPSGSGGASTPAKRCSRSVCGVHH